jgi:hypothetical protein
MKKIWIGIGIAVILALLSSCGGGGGGPATTTITGKVMDASTDKGLKGATVELSSKSRQSARVAVKTGEDGSFSLTTTAGQYTLRVTFQGYFDVEFNIVASGTVEIHIRMVPSNIQVDKVDITPPKPDGPPTPDHPEGTYKRGSSYTFEAPATAHDANGNPVTLKPTWYVTPSNIGTINEKGEFTAAQEGTGTVGAIFTGDKKASVNIKVGLIIGEEELQRYFPLTFGSQWEYHTMREQKFSTTLGESHSLTTDRTGTATITGTYSGAEFSQEVVIRQEHIVGSEIRDGVTHTVDGFHREFWTNINGEVKIWGEQDWDHNPNMSPPFNNPDTQGTWRPIEAFPQPYLIAKANATSWTGGKFGHSMDVVKLRISADATATLSTEKITVPAGTFNCYKITINFSNLQLSLPENMQLLKINSLSGQVEIWVAEGVGQVKDKTQWQGSVDFKDKETGKTGTATFSLSYVGELTSYNVK